MRIELFQFSMKIRMQGDQGVLGNVIFLAASLKLETDMEIPYLINIYLPLFLSV
jgi:hypothetical protein